jgi:hypothetical protein
LLREEKGTVEKYIKGEKKIGSIIQRLKVMQKKNI